jgi:hypothetical protein
MMFVLLLLFLQSTIGEQLRNPLLFPLCSRDSDFASDADNNEITQLSPHCLMMNFCPLIILTQAHHQKEATVMAVTGHIWHPCVAFLDP